MVSNYITSSPAQRWVLAMWASIPTPTARAEMIMAVAHVVAERYMLALNSAPEVYEAFKRELN